MRTFIHTEIPKRGKICCLGGEELTPEMEYYSLLREDAKGKWTRQDFCPSCWEKKKEEGQPQDSYWKAKVQKEKEKVVLDRNEQILELLREALGKRTAEDLQEAFILALYLFRNRKLALRAQEENWMLYEVVETEEMLRVPKVDTSALHIEKIQETLTAKLYHAVL